MKDAFLEIFDQHITREGAKDLRGYLLNSDFFVAPASTRFHAAYEGGLCEHSVNVYKRLLKSVLAEYGDFSVVSHETVAICGLLHDLCKIDFYKLEMRNVKDDGIWVQQPRYVRDERMPYGHGEKSVYVINGFIRLSRAEAMAINWHMGGFDMRARGGDFSISEAFAKYPLIVLLHASDLQATYLDEKRG